VCCFFSEEDNLEESLKLLKSEFHKVKLIALEEGNEEKNNLIKKLSDWHSPPQDFFGEKSSSLEMKETIASFLREEKFDLIHVAGVSMISYFLELNNLPVVFDSIDDPSLYFLRSVKHQEKILDKLKILKDWVVIRKFEKKYFCRFPEIVVSSETDAKIIRNFSLHSSVTVISNGVDSSYFQPVSSESNEPVLIFTGVMDYGPNVLAMMFFCKSIFPLVKRKIPEVQLYIVGKNPTQEILHWEKEFPGIKVTGWVDDMRPYLAKAQVYVSPLKSGAGIKNKILEAWAMGKPIVATSIGCEGIEVSPGEDIFVADDSERFANYVIKLLENENLRKKFGEKGREKIVEKYNWEAKANILEKVYKRTLRNFKV
jgi:glycosyltransferase involved in cell wall biosynthesis